MLAWKAVHYSCSGIMQLEIVQSQATVGVAKCCMDKDMQ